MKEHVLCLYIQVCAEHHWCHGTQCGGHVRLDRNMQTGQRKIQGDSPYKAIQTSWKISCGGRQTGAVNLICFAATQVPWERMGKQLPYQARGSHKASRRKREMEDRASGGLRIWKQKTRRHGGYEVSVQGKGLLPRSTCLQKTERPSW